MIKKLLLLFVHCFVAALPIQAEDRPNVIVIVADDLGYGDLGFTCHPHIKTPHLDQLAKNGATFTHFYSPAQVCSPSRAATLTGRMPHRHGIYSFIGGSSGSLTHLPKTETTIPQLLRKNGYQTAIIGKWHNSLIEVQKKRAKAGLNDIPTMDHYGFDYYFCSDDNAKIRNKPGWIRNGKSEGTKAGLAANIVGAEAVRWLTSGRDPQKPFIQFVQFYEPHWYVDAPEEITKQYLGSATKNKNEAIYFASITNVDREVGNIHRTLERLNLAKNTLILFTSDHGPSSLGPGKKDRNYGTAAPYRGNKYGLWDGSLHAPGIAHWPERIKPNTIINTPTGAIDWLPTICEITGTEIPSDLTLDGQSHLSLLQGKPFIRKKPLQWHHYNTNFISSPNPNAVMRVGEHLICGFYAPKTQLKRSSWKEPHLDLVQNGQLVRFQLFNILTDPFQQTDLSQKEPARFTKLKAQLIDAHREMQSQAIGWQGTHPIKTLPRKVSPPRIVATPPADAGRGLIRVSRKEIRHYPGKNGKQFLQSLDNGETWKLVDLPPTYPNATCLTKESPSIAQNPITGEFIRFEPLYRGKDPMDGVYRTKGGIDGQWQLVTAPDGNGIKPGGILRSPLWVNDNKRIVIPGHGGGCWTWYSDDQGLTWKRSNKIQSPPHQPGGTHLGTRWNHGMVEATITELKNKKLWLVARTAQDRHFESFSSDFGETWSEARPSRFWGTITMPTFHRMNDGRLLFLWSNTTALPEKSSATGRGEDVFTNRDTIHAAISEDDGKTWIGFRELILDEHRNNQNYAVTSGSNDRGKHQSEILQLDKNRILYSCGQHPIHRRLMIMDVRWLYQKERSSDPTNDGSSDWSTHQYIDKIAGHCGYNRKPGAEVKDDALRLLRVDDPTLTNPNQGATWNFPSGHAGKISIQLRLEEGNQNGLQIALTDRWFNPTDPTVAQFAHYLLRFDKDGKTESGTQVLVPGRTHTLTIIWKNEKKSAVIQLDGQPTKLTLPLAHPSPNGISYLHLYNPASQTDLKGASILKTHVTLDYP